MAVVTVRVYTLSDVPPNDPIASSVVRVFDATGTVLHTTGTTNASGYFQFDISGDTPPTEYQIRCSKLGVTFTNPEIIEVYDPLPPGTVNNFNMYGTLITLPVATDPLMCRCSGYFVDAGGRPVPDAMIRFVNIFNPVILSGLGVITGAVEIRTDTNGYAVVDLARNGKYVAQVSSLHDERLDITVPDRSSISLIDLLFPVVSSITFDPVGPWVVGVGATLVLTPTVLTSSLVTLEGTANGDVEYLSGDSEVATIATEDATITILGVKAGATTLELVRRDDSIKRSPNPDITGTGTVITVA